MRRFAAAVRKELRQFLRDRLVVALVVFLYTAEIVNQRRAQKLVPTGAASR